MHTFICIHTLVLCPSRKEKKKKKRKTSGLDNRGRGPFSEVSLHVRTDKIGSKI